MRTKILLLGILITFVFFTYCTLDVFFFKEELITSGIKMGLLGLILSGLVLLISINKASKKYRIIAYILSLGIFIPLLISLFSPALIPTSWNFILALIVLLAGVVLLIKLNGSSKILLAVIAIGIVYFEFILLLKVEQSIFFTIGGILFGFSSLAALLASFQQAKETS